MPAASAKPKGPRTTGPITLLVATQKGFFTLRSDRDRAKWSISQPAMFGHIINHVVADPRARKVWVMGARTGHLGPTVYRSLDAGKTWTEARKPPAFPKSKDKPKTVDHVLWITPGHKSEPGVWYAGTIPHGLFRSEDNGDTWVPVKGWLNNPYTTMLDEFSGAPGGHMLHSVVVDAADPSHLFVSISAGGTFESRDKGKTWKSLNKGVAIDFMPPPPPEIGHDPHCMIQSALQPTRLYQQNHCGLYRLDQPADTWVRIGDNMPRKVGDIGFPIAVHPRDPDTIWVVPMDGSSVWPRTSVEGKPAVYRSRNAGDRWERCDKGLPPKDAWLTTYRQALAVDAHDPVGVYFGTTDGSLFASADEGSTWRSLVHHLPRILAVEVA